MKKILTAVLLVFSFAMVASAEVVTFPSVGITMDVEAGWEYSDDGAGNLQVVAVDKSASMSIGKIIFAEGMTLELIVSELVKLHQGTEPQEMDIGYMYTFNNGATTVIVSQDDNTGDFAVIGTTPGTQAGAETIQRMLSSVKDI